ncbi:hypothetical protein LV475_08390 [Guyparkeria hydrothermalis]|uniref:Uncharacterized protein n=1 Tax=Guyparkeria halophila TaxID=47960 RepID=A0A6I6D1D6_9GAMM|nr:MULTISPECIES: hypothetical protein [Guyparkeria]MCL7751612.1 hypothetical protein [Guyparkeria hydrothermalis]QGT78075.1 hypothetical protein GM160_03730 [Guyparkeria halophila]TKA90452.1 hypothetical protein FAZ79_03340 [Guyparkeria sp. SB14A]
MIPRVTSLLAWPVEARLRNAPLSPVETPTDMGELITFYRERLDAFRPSAFERLSETDQARVDGLITAVLLVDGWLDAAADREAGQAMRLPANELAQLGVTDAHWREQQVDFAFRRFNERFAGRIRGILQGAAPLGRPWLAGWRYRLTIARVEQILRERQVDPALWFDHEPRRSPVAWGTASLRILWRVLTGRG